MATAPPRRRALLIGINEYPLLGESVRLFGCVNDTLLMARLLRERFGFPEEQIALLHNQAATRAAHLSRAGADTPLGQLMQLALIGRGQRLVQRTRPAPPEEWITVERTFLVRRTTP